MAGAFAAFFTGITEPLEFSFMFNGTGAVRDPPY